MPRNSRSASGTTSSRMQRRQRIPSAPIREIRSVGLICRMFDFSLAKSWGIPGWESGKLQLRMDAKTSSTIQASKIPATNSIQPLCPPGLRIQVSAEVTATTITGRTVSSQLDSPSRMQRVVSVVNERAGVQDPALSCSFGTSSSGFPGSRFPSKPKMPAASYG